MSAFAGMTRIGPGFYDDGHGAMHVDVDELVRTCGGDPANPADVEKAVEQLRATGIPVLEIEAKR